MTLLIHNNVNFTKIYIDNKVNALKNFLLKKKVNKYHDKIIENFFIEPLNQYALIKYITTEDDSPEYEAMSEAM